MARSFLFVSILAFYSFPLNARVMEYDFLTQDRKSGELIVTLNDDGSRTTHFEFNDRGRGPNTDETAHYDAKGLLTNLQVSGRAYMGAPVNENFEVKNDVATWSSTLEKGSASWTGDAWYVAGQASPESLAAFARALLATPNHSINLLPAGQATIAALTKETVTSGDQTKVVTLYTISGTDLTPDYVWLDEAGELFAMDMGWMGLTPVGWNEVMPQLRSVGQREANKHLGSLSERLSITSFPRVTITNVKIVDVKTGRIDPDHSAITLEDGVITGLWANDHEINQAGADGKIKSRIIMDGGGGYLMPGLWDMHAHISPSAGMQNIAAGVTSIRDMGNDPDKLAAAAADFDSGKIIGPNVYKAGFIDRKSPYSAPIDTLATDLDSAQALVAFYAERGYPQIKIYSSMDPAWVKPLAENIHERGMKLSGHIPSYMKTEQAIRDGFDEIQHINMLFLNFLAGAEDDTRTPVRFSLVAEHAGAEDLDSDAWKGFIKLMQDEGTIVDPTASIFYSMFTHESGNLNPSFAMIADHMPPNVKRSFLGGDMDINDENRARYRKSADALLVLIKKLHDAGIPLVAGTDDLVGFTLHRELELYAQAGIANADVLRIATMHSAKIAGSAHPEAGTVSVGAPADLILLSENPLENISALRKVERVYKGGRIYCPADIHKAVGIKPFVTDSCLAAN